MAVDSIGAKITLNKVTEVAKDANAQQRRAETMLNSALRQVEDDALKQRVQVTDVYKPEAPAIHREKEEKNKNRDREQSTEKNKAPKENKEKEEINHHLEVGVSNQKIDIRI